MFKQIFNHPADRIALQDEHETITYGQLAEAIEIRQTLLRDVKCLAIALDNSVDWIIWDLACLLSNITTIPIPPFFTFEQTLHALNNGKATHVANNEGIFKHKNNDKVACMTHEIPPATAKVTFTSGTTGNPKGVCLNRRQMESLTSSLINAIASDHGHHACILPLAILLENIAGVYTSLIAGYTVHLTSMKTFGDKYEWLHSYLSSVKATSIICVPEVLQILMGQVMAKGPISSLEFVALGGSKIYPDLISKAHELQLPVYEGYGLSECSSVVALNIPEHNRVGSVGKVLPHNHIVNERELKSGKDIEIKIKNNGFLGYIGQPAPIIIETGDLGHMDEQGYLYVTGRKKNVLITSFGRNVAPEWVESHLNVHPEILQAFVYGDGEPHLKALVVCTVQDRDLIEQRIAQANSRLPDYAQVKEFEITKPFTLESGYLTGTGRIKRQRVLEDLKAGVLHENPTAQTKEKEIMTTPFYDRLVAATQPMKDVLFKVPQVKDALAGKISIETYRAYLAQAYHHVSHTVPFLMTMGSLLPSDKRWMHKPIIEYLEEEVGHEEWILNDIAAAGGDAEAVRQSKPALETQSLVAYNYNYMQKHNPVGFFGMVYMLESTSTAIATKGAIAIKDSLNLPQKAFSYLASHGQLDIEHMSFFEKTVNAIKDENDQDAIIEVAQNTFLLFAKLLAAIPHQQDQ